MQISPLIWQYYFVQITFKPTSIVFSQTDIPTLKTGQYAIPNLKLLQVHTLASNSLFSIQF